MNHDTHCHAGHEEHGTHGGDECHGAHGGHEDHHEIMVRDFRTRFWVSLGLTIPMLILSPMIQEWLGIGEAVSFPGDRYLLLGLAIVIYIYGGKPFLAGLVRELRERQPGMMTLISLAITVAFAYSGVVMLGLQGKVFFWELATLIDVMLLGHWIEMRSVMGASRALRELVAFMPDQAHLLQDNGTAEDIAISELKPGDRVLIKPGEKVPADGEIMDGHSALDQSMLTGEATPVEKGSGDEVIGGSVNGDGSLQIEVQKAGE
jgi:P-type Cu2+ transporter